MILYIIYIINGSQGNTGKHLTGDLVRILLLNLPFLFRDLIAPRVMCSTCDIIDI